MWLQPFPDALFDETAGPLGPDARYEQFEAMSLAFVTALQVLPPRQRVVLILRDVLGFRAVEVAEILEATVESVTSALKRARATLQQRLASDCRESPPIPNSPQEEALVAELVRAYETGDIDALVALLTEDVCYSMPPIPLEYQGRELAAQFNAAVVFRHGRTYDLIPTRANGQLAFGTYVRDPAGGRRHAAGLLVFTLEGDRISAITRFDNTVLASFGLPKSLPPTSLTGPSDADQSG